jgi:hypothetical protein
VTDLIPLLLPLGPLGVAVAIVVLVILNPDKAARWGEMGWALIARVWKAKDRRAVQLGIQARLNYSSRRIADQMGRPEFTPVRVAWTEPDESVDHFFEDNRLVIRLHRHEHQDRNLVTASMLFVSQTLVRRAKTFLSKTQARSIDLFGVDWLLDDSQSAKDLFREEVLTPEVDRNPEIGELILVYRRMNRANLFFPIFVRELDYLGRRVVVRPRDERLIVDVDGLVRFLDRFAERVVGQNLPLEVQGRVLKCAIMIVATWWKREAGLLGGYVSRLQGLARGGYETVYLIGPSAPENRTFMSDVSTHFRADSGWREVGRQRYKARLRTSPTDERQQETFLITLRAPIISDITQEVEQIPPGQDLPLELAPDLDRPAALDTREHV